MIDMRILICGGAGYKNAGDEALLLAAVQACRRAAPSSEITIAANDSAVASDTLREFSDLTYVPSPRNAFFRNDYQYYVASHVFLKRLSIVRECFLNRAPDQAIASALEDPRLDFIDRADAASFLEAVRRCDAIVVHGGGILTSATRSRLLEHSFTAQLASSWGKRVLLRGHQFGPFNSDEDRDALRSMLRAASYVSTRDLNQSSPVVRELDPTSIAYDLPDDAFYVKMDDAASRTIEKYGLRENDYICVGYRHNPNVGVGDDAYRSMAAIVERIHDRLKLPVVFLPQGPFDIEPLVTLAQFLKFDVTLIKPDDPFRDPISIARRARLMIACPHHSLIFALRGGVPVISPVFGEYYMFKNTGSLRHFGLEDFVFDAAAPESADACEPLIQKIFSDEKRFRRILSRRIKALNKLASHNETTFARALVGKAPRLPLAARLRREILRPFYRPAQN